MNIGTRVPASTLSQLTAQRAPWVELMRDHAVKVADRIEVGNQTIPHALQEMEAFGLLHGLKIWGPEKSALPFVWTGATADAVQELKNELRRRETYRDESRRLMRDAAESVLSRRGSMLDAAKAVATVATKRDRMPTAGEMETALQQGAWRAKRVRGAVG